MTQPRKIRVLYFDESPDSLRRFLALCGGKELVEIAGAFRSFAEVSPLLEQDDYRFLELLAPDVIVLRLDGSGAGVAEGLLKLRKRVGVRLVGLLSGECARDRAIVGALHYHTMAAGADSLLTDEDVYTRLFYQIKSARLALNTERVGVKGKWVVFPPPRKPTLARPRDLIVIGASAGGTEAVTAILSALPGNLPPILVVQHIPDNFTAFFANNLASKVAMQIVIPHDGERLLDGTAYIAGDGKHLEVRRGEHGSYYAKCTAGEKVSGHRPSVDALFLSVAKAAGPSAVGVILTGMGSDGARGLLEMHDAGAYTIGQDQKTCAVYGMPMVAFTLGAVSKQLPLPAIAQAILTAVSAGGEKGDAHA